MALGLVIPTPRFRECDADGAPLAGGKLYAYEAGTTTPIDTYADSSLTTPNAWPVVLDSSGRAAVYVSQAEAYKFVLHNADDVAIWTQDNVSWPPEADVAAVVAGGLALLGQQANDLLVASSETQFAVLEAVPDSVLVTNAGGVPSWASQPRTLVANSPAPATGVGSTAEANLQSVTLPANTLAKDGWAVRIQAKGTFAANGNNKRVRLYFGATVIADTGVQTTNDGDWLLDAIVTRLSGTTQAAFGTTFQTGVTTGLTANDPAETLANAITIKTTGGAASSAADASSTTSTFLLVSVLRGTL